MSAAFLFNFAAANLRNHAKTNNSLWAIRPDLILCSFVFEHKLRVKLEDKRVREIFFHPSWAGVHGILIVSISVRS